MFNDSDALLPNPPSQQENEGDGEEGESATETARRAPRNSKRSRGSAADDPNKFRFYPSQWKDVMSVAVSHFRCFVSVDCGWPSDEEQDHLDAAEKCISEALVKHLDGGRRVEDGSHSSLMTGLATDHICRVLAEIQRKHAALCPFLFFPPNVSDLKLVDIE
jgi:hypothetical protein